MIRNVTLENETLNAFLVPSQPYIVVDLNLRNVHKVYYYGKFVPRLVSMLAPLYELLKTPTLEVDGATGRSIQTSKKGAFNVKGLSTL